MILAVSKVDPYLFAGGKAVKCGAALKEFEAFLGGSPRGGSVHLGFKEIQQFLAAFFPVPDGLYFLSVLECENIGKGVFRNFILIVNKAFQRCVFGFYFQICNIQAAGIVLGSEAVAEESELGSRPQFWLCRELGSGRCEALSVQAPEEAAHGVRDISFHSLGPDFKLYPDHSFGQNGYVQSLF